MAGELFEVTARESDLLPPAHLRRVADFHLLEFSSSGDQKAQRLDHDP